MWEKSAFIFIKCCGYERAWKKIISVLKQVCRWYIEHLKDQGIRGILRYLHSQPTMQDGQWAFMSMFKWHSMSRSHWICAIVLGYYKDKCLMHVPMCWSILYALKINACSRYAVQTVAMGTWGINETTWDMIQWWCPTIKESSGICRRGNVSLFSQLKPHSLLPPIN